MIIFIPNVNVHESNKCQPDNEPPRRESLEGEPADNLSVVQVPKQNSGWLVNQPAASFARSLALNQLACQAKLASRSLAAHSQTDSQAASQRYVPGARLGSHALFQFNPMGGARARARVFSKVPARPGSAQWSSRKLLLWHWQDSAPWLGHRANGSGCDTGGVLRACSEPSWR